jgi:hypothetical protein
MGKRLGGRQKGTPNKIKADLRAIAKKMGIDPFEVLLLFASGNWKKLGYDKERYISGMNEYGVFEKWTIDPAVRAKAAAEAAQYLFPKLKAIEHTGKDGESLNERPTVIVLPSNGFEAKKD